jgi:hypothetical protein
MRYLLPPGLTPEEEHAIVAALDQYFGESTSRPGPWALAGRVDALRLGALQVRHQVGRPWGGAVGHPFTRRGTEPRVGRGDSK